MVVHWLSRIITFGGWLELFLGESDAQKQISPVSTQELLSSANGSTKLSFFKRYKSWLFVYPASPSDGIWATGFLPTFFFLFFFYLITYFIFFINHHVAVLCRSRANNNLLIRFVMFFYVLECKIILFNISMWLTVPSNLLTFNFYYPKYP